MFEKLRRLPSLEEQIILCIAVDSKSAVLDSVKESVWENAKLEPQVFPQIKPQIILTPKNL